MTKAEKVEMKLEAKLADDAVGAALAVLRKHPASVRQFAIEELFLVFGECLRRGKGVPPHALLEQNAKHYARMKRVL